MSGHEEWPIVSYAHKDQPDGTRFRQRAQDALPVWAVNVTPEAVPEPTISDALIDEVTTSLKEAALRGPAVPPWRVLAQAAVNAVREYDLHPY